MQMSVICRPDFGKNSVRIHVGIFGIVFLCFAIGSSSPFTASLCSLACLTTSLHQLGLLILAPITRLLKLSLARTLTRLLNDISLARALTRLLNGYHPARRRSYSSSSRSGHRCDDTHPHSSRSTVSSASTAPQSSPGAGRPQPYMRHSYPSPQPW